MRGTVEAPAAMRRWVGQAVRRLEDQRLVTGRGTYMADLNPVSNIHHAAILRSPHAHARILRIDCSAALQMPEVRAVLTGQDVAAWMKPFPVVADHPGKYYPLAVDKVRYVGEPVAVVVARDRYLAEDALAQIVVEYEPLPAVVDPEAAMAEDAPLLHEEEGTNAALHRNFRFNDVEGAFREADVVVREKLKFNRFSCMPLETYGIIGHWDPHSQSATVWCNFQGPFSMHVVAAAAMQLPPNKFRVIVPPDVGGGFGIKIPIYPYMCLLTLASRKAGVPVKWIEDRREALAGSSSGTDRVSYVELAAKRDGTITGLRLKAVDSIGAYIRAPEPGNILRPFGNYVGGYKLRNVELDLWCVTTNKVPTGPNRGYACGHLYHALERAVDKLAGELGRDPAELRLQNLLSPDQFPYTTPTGGYYDAGDFPAVLKEALKLADYAKLRAEQLVARSEGRLVGIGLCCAVDPCASNMGYMSVANTPEQRKAEPPKSGNGEAATVTMDYGGRLNVTLNTAPQGQGHETVAAQIVADEFGCTPQEVLVTTGSDTGTRGWTIASGAYSSRFAATGANAVLLACRGLKQKLCRVAAHLLGCEEHELEVNGGQVVHRREPGKAMSLKRVAGTVHWNPTALPDGLELGLTHTAYFSIDSARPVNPDGTVNSSGLYSFAVDVAMVEIDRESYELKVLKYATVHDVGPVLNPQIVEGQLYGGALHGLAGALYEELVYDEHGQLMTGSLMDYACPTASEALDLRIKHLETPSRLTPLGARGTGEAAAMTVPGALANAVCDALMPLGVAVTDLPITPSKLFSAIQRVSQ